MYVYNLNHTYFFVLFDTFVLLKKFIFHVFLQCKHFENDNEDVDMDLIERSEEDNQDHVMEDTKSVDVRI